MKSIILTLTLLTFGSNLLNSNELDNCRKFLETLPPVTKWTELTKTKIKEYLNKKAPNFSKINGLVKYTKKNNNLFDPELLKEFVEQCEIHHFKIVREIMNLTFKDFIQDLYTRKNTSDKDKEGPAYTEFGEKISSILGEYNKIKMSRQLVNHEKTHGLTEEEMVRLIELNTQQMLVEKKLAFDLLTMRGIDVNDLTHNELINKLYKITQSEAYAPFPRIPFEEQIRSEQINIAFQNFKQQLNDPETKNHFLEELAKIF